MFIPATGMALALEKVVHSIAHTKASATQA
jgi:hypothetical protein